MVGWFAGSIGGWRAALTVFAAVPLLLWLGFRKANPQGSDPHVRSADPAAGAKTQPLPFIFWVYWFSVVLAVSAEFCMIFWSADYMENSLGMQKASAAQAVSLFLGGMIVGRLASSRLVQRFSVNQVIGASLGVALLGFLLFWTAGSILLGAVGLFITGLGIAGLYPLTLSLMIGAAGVHTVQAGARATLASGTAILTLPLVLGRLADEVGIRQAYSVVILLLVGVFLIINFPRRHREHEDFR
jgi:fucose permease